MKVPTPRKLPSGTWFAQIRVNSESVSVTAPSEKECRNKAARIKAELMENKSLTKKTNVGEKSLTLSEAIDAYISRRDAVLSPSTVWGYRAIQRTRFQKYMGKPILSITNWQAVVNEEAKLCSAKTLKNAWGLVSSALEDVVGEKPGKIKLPQVVPNEHPFFSPEQIKVFVSAVHGDPVEIPALLALSSLRRSEILALQWENVDLEHRVIKVRGAVVYDESSNMVLKRENKNPTSTRDVPILMEELHTALQKAKKDSGPVVECFPNTIWKRVNRVCEKSGLPKVGVHGLRHSFVSLAYHLGVPEKDVMAVGGWSDYQTMRKIYTHISQSDTEKHMQAMRDFYSKNANDFAKL